MNKELIRKISEDINTNYKGDIDLYLISLKEALNQDKNSDTKQKAKHDNQPKSTNQIISIKNINKYYKNGANQLHVLKDINFEIYESEMVSIMGPSGSGKSTILNILGGLDSPTSGEVIVNGKTINTLNDKQRSKYRNEEIGFVFQFFYLQPYLTVLENVEVPLMFQGNSINRKQRAEEVIKKVGLGDKINSLPAQLSGGQMQRVAIARALVTNPRIIIADEPTGNLDRNTGLEIINLLKQINTEQKTTVIIVTHDSVIAEHTDRIIEVSDGRIN